MCLILLASGAHPRYSLIVAANRDEAYTRPTATAAFWTDEPDIYAGRDLEQGGTWMGISRRGRFAAITNFRLGEPRRDAPRSRGELTRAFLSGSEDAPAYLQRVQDRAGEYNGLSLIVGVPEQLWFFSNQNGAILPIANGVHGLSNHLLDEPWPKVKTGCAALASLLDANEETLIGALYERLADRTPAPDALLPATGVTLQRERDLSPSFIAGEDYGTRASTVLLVARDGEVYFSERTFSARGEPLGGTEQRFALNPLL